MGRQFLSLLFLAFVFGLSGQGSNVDCASAIELGDVTAYCSAENEFDSEDVGDSGFPAPACWASSQNDVWFTFVASKTSVEILVNSINGSMDNPEISLLKGEDCSSLIDIGACEVNMSNLNVTSLFESSMVVGERYYIRVDARTNGNDGTFQLCVQSYNPPVVPGQDCATASILCNKDAFIVQNIEGDGLEENEAAGSCLDVGADGSENNSTWFKWTCSVSGTFTMDLRPLVLTDDYDFAVFELPNGIDDCTKTLIRCNATDGGDNEPCGPNTGLDLLSTDIEEDRDCDAGEDGYLRFIDMQAGVSYALLINNFSDSDAGFSLEFGGDAEFQGPEADFQLDFSSCGTSVGISDASVAGVSDIVSYEWEFGTTANPSSAIGPGPHNVEYTSFGEKSVTLKVVSSLGCQVFTSKEFDLQACSYLDSLELQIDSIRNIGCGGGSSGYLALIPSIECGNYEYNLDGGSFQSSAIFENLSAGDHIIGIRDENACFKDSTFTITELADFSVDAGEDVTITDQNNGVNLDASTTAIGDLTISWTPSTGIMCPDGSDNCLNPNVLISEEETYTLTVVDENGCVATDEITVFVDLCGGSDFVLDPGADVSLSFPGETVSVNVGSPGTNDVTVSWAPSEFVACADGTSNCFDPEITVFQTTTFAISIIDALGCQRSDEITVFVPDVCATSDLGIQVDSIRGDYCDGALASYIEVSGLNGNPPYEFRINDGVFGDENSFTGLLPGVYSVVVRDLFNCRDSVDVVIESIEAFTVDAGEDLTIDGLEPFEMLNGSHDASGNVAIVWTPVEGIFCPDGGVNCLNPSVNPLVTTSYTLTVTDEFGCSASDQVLVILEERLGVFAPNIFSPNEDGFNDIFTLFTDPQIVESVDRFSIFDRWGNLVFSRLNLSMNDPGAGWDGRINNNLAESGVYTWFAEVTVINNLTGESGLKKTLKGDITLIR